MLSQLPFRRAATSCFTFIHTPLLSRGQPWQRWIGTQQDASHLGHLNTTFSLLIRTSRSGPGFLPARREFLDAGTLLELICYGHPHHRINRSGRLYDWILVIVGIPIHHRIAPAGNDTATLVGIVQGYSYTGDSVNAIVEGARLRFETPGPFHVVSQGAFVGDVEKLSIRMRFCSFRIHITPLSQGITRAGHLDNLEGRLQVAPEAEARRP
mmetsp:Transcript_85325/g.174006  ORF Transcript_85325/g.174006 Transcript_85325/m.174006 type:complete len:211 (+) Transcript_85325:173-805(+)